MYKKIYIKSYGCQMNVYDSDRIVDLMKNDGYVTRCDEMLTAFVDPCKMSTHRTSYSFFHLTNVHFPIKKIETTKNKCKNNLHCNALTSVSKYNYFRIILQMALLIKRNNQY